MIQEALFMALEVLKNLDGEILDNGNVISVGLEIELLQKAWTETEICDQTIIKDYRPMYLIARERLAQQERLVQVLSKRISGLNADIQTLTGA
jgi:hypothetical protein